RVAGDELEGAVVADAVWRKLALAGQLRTDGAEALEALHGVGIGLEAIVLVAAAPSEELGALAAGARVCTERARVRPQGARVRSRVARPRPRHEVHQRRRRRDFA